MELYDVVIIGGGPGGSTSATFLARKGLNVLVLEKEKFPRFHVGESLIPLSYHVLNELDVFDDLKKISPRKPGVSFVNYDGKRQSLWCFKKVLKDESYLTFHVIRSEFDQMLLKNSRKNGAHVLEEIMVKNVELDTPDKIVRVSTTNSKGEQQEFQAKFLIDASGQHSFLAKKMQLKKSYEGLDRVAIWSHWSNTKFDQSLNQGAIKIVYLGGENKKGWIWLIPISKEILSIGVVLNNSYVKEEKKKIQDLNPENWEETLYLQELKESYLFNSILKNAKLEHKSELIGNYSYYCDKKYGENFALVGDSGAFLDPVFSSGVYVAMHSGKIVSEAIYEKLISNNSIKSQQLMADTFDEITGALKLIEKFVRLFYTPEIIDFSSLGDPSSLKYEKFETAYNIFHYLLAGDFFKNYQKYSDFIDIIKEQKSMIKFQNLIQHSKNSIPNADCGEKYEDMYGEMTHEVSF